MAEEEQNVNEQHEELSADTLKTMLEEYKTQLAELKNELRETREQHKKEIVEIMRGGNNPEEKTEEEKQLEDAIKKINNERRMY